MPRTLLLQAPGAETLAVRKSSKPRGCRVAGLIGPGAAGWFIVPAHSAASIRSEPHRAASIHPSRAWSEPRGIRSALLLALRPPIFNMTEHDAEDFRRTFEGQPYRGAADEIRMNDPARTILYVGTSHVGSNRRGLSDNAARLLGRYIATNEHMTRFHISNRLAAIDSLFEGLRGSRSLTYLGIATRLSEQVVQSMQPFLMNAPELKELDLNLGSASLRPILRTLNGRSIEKLSLMDGDIGDISVFGLLNLPSLKSLLIKNSGINSVPPLHGFPELTRLSLFGNKIDKEGFMRLNEYIASDSCQLDSLNLRSTAWQTKTFHHSLEHSSTTDLLQGLI